MKLIGLLLTFLGWLFPLATLSVVQSTTARMIVALIGIAISLVGILVVLNKAHLNKAIWKA
jgi:hypothetical protein